GESLSNILTTSDPPMQFSGEVMVQLNGEGRLRGLRAIPPQQESSLTPAPPPNWTTLFAEAGLDSTQWQPVDPQWTPLHYADARAAWQGSLPDAPGIPIRIEAAAYRGRPVSFEIIGPWTQPERMFPVEVPTSQEIVNGILVLLLTVLLLGGLFFARHNLRLG